MCMCTGVLPVTTVRARAQGFARRHADGFAAAAEEEARALAAAAAAAAEAAVGAAAAPRARSSARPPPAKPCVRGGALSGALGSTSAAAGVLAPGFGGLLARQSSSFGGAAAGKPLNGGALEQPGSALAVARSCLFAEAALAAADDMQARSRQTLHGPAGAYHARPVLSA